MHMADALINPAVGGTMWAFAAGAIACCSEQLKRHLDDRTVPLMGVLGAFIFSAQMINFTIPGTGSSGHIGGGLLLAVLLGPAAGFIVMASVLTVQAFFFADGGLLALGSNIINLGAATCFVAYPLFFRPLAGQLPGRGRLLLACLVASVAGLQLGSFGVVAETVLSGKVDLPFASFLLLMQPIHLAIGLVEGGMTAFVISLIWKARPEIFALNAPTHAAHGLFSKQLLVSLLVTTMVCGGLLSGFASSMPDGLEWALDKASAGDRAISIVSGESQSVLERIQQQTALLPDYGFRHGSSHGSDGGAGTAAAGTAVSGLAGGLLTLLLIVLGGCLACFKQGRSDSI
ncbi:MAG: cobalamin biosynthesis protein CbiM [Desulfuromonas sp.]|jgi:cobalt/nickel transport system permease protein|nr:MAG: cobalamin biosynthesis protein CbiM [Desulfuromonas sp.]